MPILRWQPVTSHDIGSENMELAELAIHVEKRGVVRGEYGNHE